jgi:putative inorganic carbon (HCO3(-)) transporter
MRAMGAVRLPAMPAAVAATAAAAAVAVVGVAVGIVVGAIGARFGISVMIGLPLVALLVLATLSRPATGVALVLLAIPIGLKTLPVGFVVVQGVAMLAIGAMVLVRLARGQSPLPWSPPLIWGVAVFALCLAATPRAVDTTLATKQDIDLALGLLLVLTAYAAAPSLDAVRRLAHVLLGVGLVVALMSLGHASALHAVAGAQRVDNRLRGTFTEPNQFGGFSAIVLVVAVGIALGARSRRERWWAAGVASLDGLAMLLALSRGAWIGVMLAGVLLLVLVPRARRALALTVVALAAAVPLFGLFTPDLPQVTVVRQRVSTLHLPASTPYDSRPAIWREAAREIGTSPLLGEGPGQFPIVSRQAASSAATVYADHAHDVLLTTAAEAGIPAALAVIGFTVTMLIVLVRAVRRLEGTPDGPLVAGLGASLAVVVGQGAVDFTLRNADIFLLLSVLVGLTIAAARAADATDVADPRP